MTWLLLAVIGILGLRCGYLSWRLDNGGKTAKEIWRESGYDV